MIFAVAEVGQFAETVVAVFLQQLPVVVSAVPVFFAVEVEVLLGAIFVAPLVVAEAVLVVVVIVVVVIVLLGHEPVVLEAVFVVVQEAST